eukprot:CAMPEP_0184123694 /NCGR_PEP_ID=MMETSP0974-20121125/24133_1 /TAXON_ID=483370 /ORGANISM="non described non described, Strain CCMP2097" /LENGTH=78 /DNA_ID=CAMNT_0026426967 /DNA_START=1 /DNA_END=237 /DNA_ORIENTATION=+
MATFNAQDLANTLWAYSTAGVDASALFVAMAVIVEAKMGASSSAHLSRLPLSRRKAALRAASSQSLSKVDFSKGSIVT